MRKRKASTATTTTNNSLGIRSHRFLNVTVISYIDRMDFGFTVDPDLVPDPWDMADRIPSALDELERDVERFAGPPD